MVPRVLVTGGAGFIGSQVTDRFLTEGWQVAVVDNLSSGRREFVHPAAEFYPYSIRDQHTADLIMEWRPEIIAHHAAQIDVRQSVADPSFDAGENILGSLNICQAAVKAGVKKIIFASTGGAIYGDAAPVPADENALTQPESPYGIAKLAVEKYLYFFWKEYGLIPIILRYANVYGPRQNGLGEAGVVAIFIEKFLAGQQPIINGDGLQTRDFVYVADVVAANLLAARYPHPEICNIGTGRETDILTVYLQVQKLLHSPLGPVHGPAKPGEQRRSALNCRKAQQVLGWQPQVSLADGLARTVAAFRQHQEA
jgi:UDP-glucose 4-epimerase